MRYLSQAEIEPGMCLDGKIIQGWHISDTSFTWYYFGSMCQYATLKFVGGETLPIALIR
jgi:hypothetical protein